jgi:hypothetical protein
VDTRKPLSRWCGRKEVGAWRPPRLPMSALGRADVASIDRAIEGGTRCGMH